ncbi:MAG: AmmeMemoRadiSam system protein A [Kiritimatiellia bacterium]
MRMFLSFFLAAALVTPTVVTFGAASKPVAAPSEEATTTKRTGESKTMTTKIKEHRSGEWSPGLTDEEKANLFAIAEDTLAWCVKGRRGSFSFEGYTLTPKLREKMATFVTFKEHGELRGCIGSLEPVESLYQSVHNNTINAALHDYRFAPVTEAELKYIELHISILSPIVPIKSLDEFHIGEHGIIIEKGPYRAVYLPEVAVEQKWTKEETLTSLSRKAGMDGNAWRQGASFKVFSSVALSK